MRVSGVERLSQGFHAYRHQTQDGTVLALGSGGDQMTDQLDTLLGIARMLPDDQVHTTHEGRSGREGDPQAG